MKRLWPSSSGIFWLAPAVLLVLLATLATLQYRWSGELSEAEGARLRASARLRKGTARLEVRASLFCSVRDAPRAPLCVFYLALATEILRRFALPSQGRVVQCHAIEHTACVLALDLVGAALVADPAIAA